MWMIVQRLILPVLLLLVAVASVIYGAKYHCVDIGTEKEEEIPIAGAMDFPSGPFGPPMDFGQPPDFAQPDAGQPDFGQPDFGQPGFGQPPYGDPAFGQPPDFGQPPLGEPAFGMPPPFDPANPFAVAAPTTELKTVLAVEKERETVLIREVTFGGVVRGWHVQVEIDDTWIDAPVGADLAKVFRSDWEARQYGESQFESERWQVVRSENITRTYTGEPPSLCPT